jgi:asparagine synthase (glutamine-hydrolysing)
MCGIIAQINSGRETPSRLLDHRGPDQNVVFEFENLFVEFTRLSVTGGVQGNAPIYSQNRGWVVFLNGEVYNYKSLQKSYSLPYTDSDTQVVADGIELMGIKFLSNLRGMFVGLALDLKNRKLFVFRDALGEKPLFILKENDLVSFASEFRALVKLRKKNLQLNQEAVASYFRFSYAEEPDTFDVSILPFPKGQVISYDLVGGNSRVELTLSGYSNAELDLQLEDLLELILDEQLAVDVSSGLALSGGIDSNALLFAKSQRLGNTFKPIIVDLVDYPWLSEAPDAIAACIRLGIEPTVINLQFTNLDQKLTNLATMNDQPHADPSGLSYSQIFACAQEMNLKVVFLGHGPDEFFWGYPWLVKQLQRSLRPQLIPFLNKSSPRPFWNTPALNSRFLKRKFNDFFSPISFGSDDINLSSADQWERYRAFITHSYLSDNGLRQSDRLGMAYSIEPRTPFADSRLYGWSQHNSFRDKRSFDKSEFRNAVELGANDSVRQRQKKGFASPYDEWLKNSHVLELVYFAAEQIERQDIGWLDKIDVSKLNAQESYRVLMLGLWLSGFNQNY